MRKISLSNLSKIDSYWENNKKQLIGQIVTQNPSLSKINFPKMTRKRWERALGTLFRQDVADIYENSKTRITLNTAIKQQLHTTAFISSEQIHRENLLSRAKKDKQIYKKIQDAFRKNGRYGKIEFESIKYEGKTEYGQDLYSKYSINTMNGQAFIYVTQSPKGSLSSIFFSEMSL